MTYADVGGTATAVTFTDTRKPRRKLTRWQQIMKRDIERSIRWWMPGYHLAKNRKRKVNHAPT